LTRARAGGRPPQRGGTGGARRADRIAAEIQRIVSAELLHRVRDPRVAHVTVTRVRVSDDLSLARVFFTLLEVGEGNRAEALRGLDSATPFFRRTVAGELGLRHAPEIAFAYDDDLANARRIDTLLRDIREQRAQDPADPGASEADGATDDDGGDGGQDRG